MILMPAEGSPLNQNALGGGSNQSQQNLHCPTLLIAPPYQLNRHLEFLQDDIAPKTYYHFLATTECTRLVAHGRHVLFVALLTRNFA